jgi:penicillin-insensitive murein endopeptidase
VLIFNWVIRPHRRHPAAGLRGQWLIFPAGIFLCAFAHVVTSAPQARADENENPWAKLKTVSQGPARALGGYSDGCLAGAAALPLEGPGFQIAQPARGRRYGHPQLIAAITDLAAAVHNARLRPLMIGDLSQPRGGPAPGGHASHQTGLDVDIWYWAPALTQLRSLNRDEREKLKPRPVVDSETNRFTATWSARIPKLLELAASDPRVARVFVHPAIKQRLCQETGNHRGWLQKIRPWWGHNDHFHLRLSCPDDSPDCVPQADHSEGDGCSELAWWLDPKTAQERSQGRARYRTKQTTVPQLPTGCADVLRE